MAPELIKSKTRRDTLVLDGFMYVHNVVKGERIYWECIEKRPYQCFGRAVTMGDRTYCSREHTHPPDPAKIELRKAEELCRDRAMATDSHANAIITSVVKMLSPTPNPYITTSNLLKTIRRVRKRAILRVSAATKKTNALKSGSTAKSGQPRHKSKSERSVGSILSRAASIDTESGLFRLPDTTAEVCDVKPSNFMNGCTETPSQLIHNSAKSSVDQSPSKANVYDENPPLKKVASLEAGVSNADTIIQVPSDSTGNASGGLGPIPTDEDVLREFIALEKGHSAAANSSSGSRSLSPGARASCSTPSDFRKIRRRRQLNNGVGLNWTSRLQGTLLEGGSRDGDIPQQFRIQGSLVCANNSTNGIRPAAVMDGSLNMPRRCFINQGKPSEDFDVPCTSNILAALPAINKRRTPDVATSSFSSPFRPYFGNVPLTKNIRYLDSGQTFLLKSPDQDNSLSNDRFIVFSTEKCLGMLEWHEWAVDIDTDTLPDSFAYGQLVTVYARIETRNVRCAWVLLSSRSVLLCVRALHALKHNRNNLNPSVIYTDYDRSLVMALEKAFPFARLRGSFEHLRRRIFQEVSRHSVQQLCPVYGTVVEKIKMILALAFVPSIYVQGVFQELEEKLGLPIEAQPILNYFEDAFIGRPYRGGRKLPLFNLSLWNSHQHLISSHQSPFEIWPHRTWGRDRCASCRLRLDDFETNLKEEYATTMREYEHLVGGNLTFEGSDHLQARNLKVRSAVANFRKTDVMAFLAEVAAEIQ